MTVFSAGAEVIRRAALPVVELQHDLPVGSDFFIVQFVRALTAPESVIVVRDALRFPLAMIDQYAAYKLLAFKISDGIADGVWWVDDYVYDSEQVNISFKSSGDAASSGDPGSFTGSVRVADQPAARNVIATALDADPPYQLARTMSDPGDGQYTVAVDISGASERDAGAVVDRLSGELGVCW